MVMLRPARRRDGQTGRTQVSGLVKISEIRMDFQPSENLIEETVQAYIQQLNDGEQLPPVTVRFDGQNYFLQDGFHRVEALRRLGIETVQADISEGTLSEMEDDWGNYLRQLKTSLLQARPNESK